MGSKIGLSKKNFILLIAKNYLLFRNWAGLIKSSSHSSKLLLSKGNYPQSLLDTRDWFPPRLAYSKAIDASPDAVKSLKPCKVIVDSSLATNFDVCSLGPIKEEERINEMLEFAIIFE